MSYNDKRKRKKLKVGDFVSIEDAKKLFDCTDDQMELAEHNQNFSFFEKDDIYYVVDGQNNTLLYKNKSEPKLHLSDQERNIFISYNKEKETLISKINSKGKESTLLKSPLLDYFYLSIKDTDKNGVPIVSYLNKKEQTYELFKIKNNKKEVIISANTNANEKRFEYRGMHKNGDILITERIEPSISNAIFKIKPQEQGYEKEFIIDNTYYPEFKNKDTNNEEARKGTYTLKSTRYLSDKESEIFFVDLIETQYDELNKCGVYLDVDLNLSTEELIADYVEQLKAAKKNDILKNIDKNVEVAKKESTIKQLTAVIINLQVK